MRSFGSSSTFVNATTPYYDLQTTLQRNLVSTGFSADATQYGNAGSFYRSKNALVGVGFSGESLECSDSYSYFDANGGGVPPAFPPTDPFPTTITATGITVNFSSQGSSGNPPATYGIYYGAVRPDTFISSVNAFGSLYVSQVTGLLPGTKYYFQAIAQNPQGFLLSGISEVTTASVPPSPSPPSSAPTIPTLISATQTSLTIQFDVTGITGSPAPSFQGGFGTTVFPAVQVSGTLYQAVATGLEPNTPIGCFSVAYNESGTVQSSSVTFSTLPASLTPPSSAPSVPTLVSATTTTITIEFDVAGISGNPTPVYYATQGGTQLPATPTSGTKYQATATGLLPGTSYPFSSSATNSQGTKNSASASFSTNSAPPPPPPPPTELQTLFVIDFLLFDGIQWVIDQQNIPDIGQWFLTGSNAGQIQANTGQSVVPYLKSLQAQGCKILLSFGGGGLSELILNTMFANPQNTAASICYALLTKGSGTNPLGFAKTGTPWADFAFDGLDMDVEVNTPQPSDQYEVLQAIHALVPSAILTSAPQAPNLVTPNAFGGNGNGSWYPFPRVFPSDTLANYNTASSTSAFMYPPLLASCGMSYMFVQFYNQDPSWYPGTIGTSFVPALAMWGFLCVKSQAVLGTGCKLIVGFATDDGNPIWDLTRDGPALNSAITQANTLITAESGFSSVVPSMWLAGWGAWNAPSANSPAGAVYSASGILNLPINATMLYTNNSGSPSLNPQWAGPIPVTR